MRVAAHITYSDLLYLVGRGDGESADAERIFSIALKSQQIFEYWQWRHISTNFVPQRQIPALHLTITYFMNRSEF